MAFRGAVLQDPEPFGDPGVTTGDVLIEAQRFLACWERGLPWPPATIQLPSAAPSVPPPARIAALAGIAAAVGIELARVLVLDVEGAN